MTGHKPWASDLNLLFICNDDDAQATALFVMFK